MIAQWVATLIDQCLGTSCLQMPDDPSGFMLMPRYDRVDVVGHDRTGVHLVTGLVNRLLESPRNRQGLEPVKPHRRIGQRVLPPQALPDVVRIVGQGPPSRNGG